MCVGVRVRKRRGEERRGEERGEGIAGHGRKGDERSLTMGCRVQSALLKGEGPLLCLLDFLAFF